MSNIAEVVRERIRQRAKNRCELFKPSRLCDGMASD